MENTFARQARKAAYATAAAGIVYSVAFTIVVQRGSRWAQWTAASALTVGALLALPVIMEVTSLLGSSRNKEAPARLAMTIGGIAAVMTSLHGAYDLAGLADPQSAGGNISPVDPRGFATFALAGLALLLIASLARDDRRFPHWLPTVGSLLGAALLATWLGRLVVLDPTSVWLRVATSVAAVLNPIAYIGFASACRRPSTQDVIGTDRRLDVPSPHPY
jgi:hypothetical protein